MRGPQLRRLPIDRTDEGTNHRLGRSLDPRESKVGDFGDSRSGDEDVGGLDVAMDDGGFASVEVLDSVRDAEHYFEHLGERRWVRLADVVEEVAVGAEFGDDHDGDGGGLFGNRDADEVDDVFVTEVAEESEFFDVHVGEVATDVTDGDDLLAVLALVDILRKEKKKSATREREDGDDGEKRTLKPPLPTRSSFSNASAGISLSCNCRLSRSNAFTSS